jgi:hypothetical protein
MVGEGIAPLTATTERSVQSPVTPLFSTRAIVIDTSCRGFRRGNGREATPVGIAIVQPIPIPMMYLDHALCPEV